MSGRRGVFTPSRVFSVRGVRWYEVDWHVLGIALALLGIGLLFVHAIAGSTANEVTREVSFAAHRQKVLSPSPSSCSVSSSARAGCGATRPGCISAASPC